MPTTARLQAALADRYVIEELIGSGGMATVYRARDVKHDRDVALKVLRQDLSAVLGVERFLAEVKITARLDHPHILTLIDSGEADGILFYVLPLVRGESLRAKLAREKQLGLDEAISITKQIASALDYAHSQGVIHRDIKPENILLHEGEAVLADFGIALAVREAGGNRLTETGLSLGTPQYMSPEQATGDRTLDARSDVYSLGAVLYEMIAGEPPVTGATAQAMIAKLLTERPTRLRVVRDTVPEAMERAVEKALAKIPADRFTSAGGLVVALQSSLTARRHSTSLRVRPRMAIGGGVLLLSALAVLGVWIARRDRNVATSVTLRDRTQITSTGNVQLPAISPDAKTLAYVARNCVLATCTYGIELQDVGGAASRRLYDGATSIYGIEWSPDRRNLLFNGTVRGEFGVFLISALGGEPRHVSDARATFWAGGDSLLATGVERGRSEYWIRVGGLDGVYRDSIRVPGPGDLLGHMALVPNTRWIIVGLYSPSSIEWRVIDRSGKQASRFAMKSTYGFQRTHVSTDALWIAPTTAGGSRAHIVRVPFDAASGSLASRGDTVYSGGFTAFGVSADGGSLILDEGSSTYDAWVIGLGDALHGRFPTDGPLIHSTSNIQMSLSPDGERLFFARDIGLAPGAAHWSIRTVKGGGEVPVVVNGDFYGKDWIDATRVAIADRTPSGLRFGVMNVVTGVTTDWFDCPDPAVADFARLPDGGWVWLATHASIAVQRPGERAPRRFPLPPWLGSAYGTALLRGGEQIAFSGYKAPREDSVGVGVMSLATGAATMWFARYAESATVRGMTDGTVGVMIADTPETFSVYKLRGPGQAERVGSVPRAVEGLSISHDWRRASMVTRDYHGDVWMSKVVRR